jgi:hypothetical protein
MELALIRDVIFMKKVDAWENLIAVMRWQHNAVDYAV